MTEEEIKSAIADAVATETKGLKEKNSELLGKIKRLEDEKADAETKAQEAEDEAANASSSVEERITRLEAKHKRELDKITKDRDDAQALNRTHLIDGAITKALVDNNVPAHFHEALTAQFRAGADVRDGKALRGDADLSEALSTFFAGDVGKHYVAAPATSGGGATGSDSGRVADHGFTADNFKQREGEWLALSMKNPALAKSIASEVGRSDLLNGL